MHKFAIVSVVCCEGCGSEVTEIDEAGLCHSCAWEAQAMQELRDMDEYTMEEIDKAEVCESGQVHFHRGAYDITGSGFVTSFKDFMKEVE